MMEQIKTTVKLTSVEEIDELFKRHPELVVQLSQKAAQQVAHCIKNEYFTEFVKVCKDALTPPFWRSSSPDASWLMVVPDAKNVVRFELGREAKKFIEEHVREQVNEQTQAAARGAMTELSQNVRNEFLKQVNIQDVVEDAKRAMMYAIKNRIDLELSKSIFNKEAESK